MDWIILTLSIILVALLILILILKRKKKKVEKQYRENFFQKVNLVNKIKDPKDSLLTLSKIVKDYLKEYLQEKEGLTYKELSIVLRQKKDEVFANFCDALDYYLYSGIEIKKEIVLRLIDKFIELVRKKEKGIVKKQDKKINKN